jgi:copper chaperone CopZ
MAPLAVRLVLLVVVAASLGACGGRRKQAVQPNDRASCEVEIEVSGVPCEANCPLVERALSGVDGVTGVRMDWPSRTASVQAVHPACGGAGFDEMIGALDDYGFGGSIASTR